MKLRKWLKNINPIGLNIVVWDEDSIKDEEPAFAGSAWDLPWWVAEGKISKLNENDDEPIDFRENLGKEFKNKPGVVVTVKF